MAKVDKSFVEDLVPLVKSLTSAEKIDISEAIFERNEEYQEFGASTIHKMLTGIKTGNVIPIISDNYNGEAFPFNTATDCSVPTCETDTIKFSSHLWETALIECKIAICLRSFNDDFSRFWNGGAKDDFDEDVTSALVQYLVKQFKGGLNLAKWRVAYFGDKSFTGPVANFYNGINGAFVQMQAKQPDNVIKITQNQATTFADQKNITGKDIYNYLVAMMDKYQEQLWNDGGELKFRMTKLTAHKLMNYFNRLEDKTCCGSLEVLNPAGIQGSKTATIDNLRFDGYKIEVVSEWDYLINNNSGLNGGGGNAPRLDPHRIVFTYANNVLFGTESTKTIENFKIWYSDDDDKIYMKGGARIGAGVPLDNYILAI